MAWDTARTRRLLLEAAVEEYARHGPAGARLDRIAAAAGVNKERIYQYFGNKEDLFGAVLQQELETIAAAVALRPDESDLGEYAGRVFDYHQEHPHFARLLVWEGLYPERGIAAQSARAAHYAGKVEALSAAQKAGMVAADLPAGYLLYAVIALAAWWTVTPQLTHLLAVGVASDGPAARREALVRMVRKLAA